jgi:hypothetical protein
MLMVASLHNIHFYAQIHLTISEVSRYRCVLSKSVARAPSVALPIRGGVA